MLSRQQKLTLVPWAFVGIWSTGFIGAKYAVPYMEPFSVLFLRMFLTLIVFAALMFWRKPQWCSPKQAGHQMVVGLLVHACYLGGVFVAIDWALPAGITSLIMGVQPLLTALIGWLWISERLHKAQWLGLVLGFLGVLLVVSQNGAQNSDAAGWDAWTAAIVALLAISIGTLYQKRFGGGVDLMVGAFYQYLVTAIVMALLAWQFDSGEVIWSWPLLGAVLWMVLALSVTAILLFLVMIREGEASKVVSYFYLVPPLTALEAWLLFDETLNIYALCGIGVTVAGVYLTVKRRV
ncbi:DMT family transporter [Neptuniibacter sp. 1_MG-2023]|uniref:DMT family transporter n=1 Tax=Neptuniibacter sp. 1_MG-2023 TaxID=3062662 RepID=UPI0026E1DBE3|nr:DMT family transporter [Neptuniibacter sp. 1_MG-2023]MDO6594986.1 DMT family transporter [Neptuniibacter sp. 1_MG-2023]